MYLTPTVLLCPYLPKANTTKYGSHSYEEITPYASEIIEEYQEVIARNINPWLAETIVTTIINRNNVIKADTHFHFNLIQADKDDNKFVDCAIVTNARYIVTEDKHFNVLRSISFPIVDVINIDAFLKILSTIIPQNL